MQRVINFFTALGVVAAVVIIGWVSIQIYKANTQSTQDAATIHMSDAQMAALMDGLNKKAQQLVPAGTTNAATAETKTPQAETNLGAHWETDSSGYRADTLEKMLVRCDIKLDRDKAQTYVSDRTYEQVKRDVGRFCNNSDRTSPIAKLAVLEKDEQAANQDDQDEPPPAEQDNTRIAGGYGDEPYPRHFRRHGRHADIEMVADHKRNVDDCQMKGGRLQFDYSHPIPLPRGGTRYRYVCR
ncbi:MAG: hypothetical protein KGI70_01155 [Patescibacteria group bacterium]|nr:hypothetical protein [Patescibacteria group bacterium]